MIATPEHTYPLQWTRRLQEHVFQACTSALATRKRHGLGPQIRHFTPREPWLLCEEDLAAVANIAWHEPGKGALLHLRSGSWALVDTALNYVFWCTNIAELQELAPELVPFATQLRGAA